MKKTYTLGGRLFLALMGALFSILLVFELMYIFKGGFRYAITFLAFGFGCYITFLCFFAAYYGQTPQWYDDRSIFNS